MQEQEKKKDENWKKEEAEENEVGDRKTISLFV
jgi:hypothetical protein